MSKRWIGVVVVAASLGAACSDGQTLTADGSCVTPGETRCDGDDVQTCGSSGRWSVTERCATRCEAGSCTAPACTPASTRCDGPDVQQCNGRGTGWEFRQACFTSCVDGACVTPICAPFGRRCVGLDVEECDERGVSWRRIETCSAACEAGACITTTPCAEGTVRCNSRIVERCRGGVWEFSELCETTTCIAGACAACVPGAHRCSGAEAQVCRADGTGWDGAETCSIACVSGVCAACDPGARRCAGEVVEVCAADGSGWVPSSYCATACRAGACASPECAPGAVRCDAGAAQVCSSGGIWVTTETCERECVAGRCATCTPGTLRCSGTAVEACATDGSGWSFVQYCVTGCTSGACNPLTCAPLSRRCNGRIVEVCGPTGDGWAEMETCASTCRDGVCTGSAGGVCVPGSYRCAANDVEACDSVGGGWFYIQTCIEGCSAGACSGTACMPFDVSVAPAAGRADGNSTVLARTGPIVDVSGTPVADGTLVTVEATQGSILAVDADPSTTAIEVAAFRGRTDVAIEAPAAAASGRVTFTLRGATRCTGYASTTFNTSGTTQRSVSLDLTDTAPRDAASTTAFWDVDLGRLTAGTTTFGFGEDGDLVVTGTHNINTTVRAGRAYADAPNYRVAFIEASSVTLDALPNALSSGDDVLLINLQGSATANANVGNFEVLTVLRKEGLRVYFVSPVRFVYGVGGNTDLTGQKIMLQRVPRYRNVSIDGTLTANAWNGTVGGVLFFKASGTVSVNLGGTITMETRGYRGGAASSSPTQGESYPGVGAANNAAANGGGGGSSRPCSCSGSNSAGAGHAAAGSRPGGCGTMGAVGAAYGTALLDRWFMGSGGGGLYEYCSWGYTGGGGIGGGILAVFAPTITNAGSISAAGGAGTSSYGWLGGGGSGGSLYLLGNTVTLGANLVNARGGSAGSANAGADGRIRVDGTTVTGTTQPTLTAGPAPTPVAATARTLTLDDVSAAIRSARIVAVEAYQPGTSLLRYYLSNNGGAAWAEATVGTALTFAEAGSDLRLRVDWESVGPSGVPSLAGIAVEYATD